MSDLGHEVVTTGNGQELVKYALTSRPDLIVTDMHMPEMRGDSMTAMPGMYPPLAGIPVIMVRGATKMAIEDAGIPAEIPIIPKPVDFDRLASEVNKAAGRLGK